MGKQFGIDPMTARVMRNRGIESESDESLCRDMAASYLQGYKFSRPVPIADLRKFLERKGKAG